MHDRQILHATVQGLLRQATEIKGLDVNSWLREEDGREAVVDLLTTTLGRVYNSAHAVKLTKAFAALRACQKDDGRGTMFLRASLRGHPEIDSELKRLEAILAASVMEAPQPLAKACPAGIRHIAGECDQECDRIAGMFAQR